MIVSTDCLDLHSDAFELESNPSIAPSQSASQMAYDDLPTRNGLPFAKHGPLRGTGSIAGSIAEEDEGNSSGEDVGPGALVMHENKKVARPMPDRVRSPTSTVPAKPSPLGVPSVNARSRPLSSTLGSAAGGGGDDSSDEGGNPRGGRRATSDIGVMGYRPPTGRQPLRRTFSEEKVNGETAAPRKAASDTSSVKHSAPKKGFFASIGRLFKGGRSRREGSIRSGRDSPPYGSSSKGGWHTRTDSNIKQTGGFGGRRRGGDDSSSDDEPGNFISVSNNRDSTAFTVENLGRVPAAGTKPVHSGLASRPTKSDLGVNKRGGSQSTLTAAKTTTGSRPTSPTPSAIKAPPSGTLTRSGTVKSSTSTGTAKGTIKKTRQNGSISRAALGSQQAAEGRNIMSLVDMTTPPAMPEVPKAPKSQVTPHLELAKAPGSSILPTTPGITTSVGAPKTASPKTETARPASRTSNRGDRAGATTPAQPRPLSAQPTQDDDAPAPRPPSRLVQPPLKSALRPLSPSTSEDNSPTLSPPIEPPSSMFTISAPGPVQLPREELKPIRIPTAAPKSTPAPIIAARPAKPAVIERDSHQSMTTSDGQSVYESAVDGDASSDDGDEADYDIVENDAISRSGIVVGPPAVEKIPAERHYDDVDSVYSDDTATGRKGTAAPASDVGSRSGRRPKSVKSVKSVRMAIPGSPSVEKLPRPEPSAAPVPAPREAPSIERTGSPPPENMQEQWKTRIGYMREDTSDEEEKDEDYVNARKGLIRNSGKWEAVSNKPKKRSSSNKGSVKG